MPQPETTHKDTIGRSRVLREFGINPFEVDASPKHPILEEVETEDVERIIYAKANSDLTRHHVCAINSNGNATHVHGGDIGKKVGIPLTDIPNGSYAWFKTRGIVDVHVEAGTAAGAFLHTTLTAGQLGQTLSASNKTVVNIRLMQDRGNTAGTASASLSYFPRVMDMFTPERPPSPPIKVPSKRMEIIGDGISVGIGDGNSVGIVADSPRDLTAQLYWVKDTLMVRICPPCDPFVVAENPAQDSKGNPAKVIHEHGLSPLYKDYLERYPANN